MFSRLSVNVLLKSAIAALAGVIILVLAFGAWSSWTGLVVANRIAAVTEASGHLFTALHNLRLDRTGSYRDLMGDRQLTALNSQVKTVREAEMPALREALVALAAVDLADKEEVVANLRAAVDRLAALHEESTAAMMKPKAERRTGLGQEFLQHTTLMLDMVDGLSSRLSRFVKLQDPFVDQLLGLKQLAWDLRNAGGDASLLISGTLGGRPIPADAVRKHETYIVRMETVWEMLQDFAAGLPLPPAYAAAVEKTKAQFFAPEYIELRAKLVKALAAGEKIEFTAEKWLAMSSSRLGTALGIAEVALTTAKDYAVQQRANATRMLSLQIGLLAVAFVLALAMMLVISRRVTSPLMTIQQAMLKLAGGDMTAEASFPGRKDEIGKLASAMQAFKDAMIETDRLRAEQKDAELRAAEEQRLAATREADQRKIAEARELAGQIAARHKLADDFEAAVGRIIDKVSSASSELEASAGTLTQTADTTLQLAGVVSSASEEASANVGAVASAAEEMTGSVNEIARQVQESSRIASEAVEQADKTDARINELSKAAARIGDVVKLISAVAEQTNLLALNATIEAARAGEAGKGFAVVASEVKLLAAQTAKATDEIGTQIAGMQTATAESVGAIKEIGGTIGRISEIAAAIAAAVEEQGAATGEIARNVQQAARGTSQVADTIADVNRGASATGAASAQVLSSAKSLSQESHQLKSEVEKFLGTVRAA